jgi:hypothetical protein
MDLAVPYLKLAVAANPSSYAANMTLASMLRKSTNYNQRFHQALFYCKAALKIDPKSLFAIDMLDELSMITLPNGLKLPCPFDWLEFKYTLPPSRSWVVGERVKLDGLVARPDLNGLEGVVVEEYNEVTGRFAVRLDSRSFQNSEMEASKFVLVRCINLIDVPQVALPNYAP